MDRTRLLGSRLMCSGKVGAWLASKITVYSVVESTSGSGRGEGRVGIAVVGGGGGEGVGGMRVWAMAEGVVEALGDRRRRRRVTVAKESGAGGGKSSAASIESWEEVGGGRVSIGGADAKRTDLGFDVGVGADQLRKALKFAEGMPSAGW